MIALLEQEGSPALKNSEYYQSCLDVFSKSVLDIFGQMIIGSVGIFGMTLVLHRRRAWVLSAPRGLLAFTTKYMPVLGYGTYELSSRVMVPTDQVQSDFGTMQE